MTAKNLQPQEISSVRIEVSDNENNMLYAVHKNTWLQPEMKFYQVSQLAINLYSKKEFHKFKQEFNQMRQKYSTGLGLLVRIPFLDKKNGPTLQDLFSVMNEEQSQRFQDEFFNAIIPHWVTQQELWKNIGNEKSGEYDVKIKGSWVSKMIFKFLAKVLSEQKFIEAVVMTQKTTWVDDDKKTFNLHSKMV